MGIHDGAGSAVITVIGSALHLFEKDVLKTTRENGIPVFQLEWLLLPFQEHNAVEDCQDACGGQP